MALVVLCALVVGPAGAEEVVVRAPVLESSGELPCTREELEDAIALRVDGATLRGPIGVRGSPGMVEIVYAGRARVLSVEGRGRAQARRIALAITDLVREERALGAAVSPEVPPHAVRAAGDDAGSAAVVPARVRLPARVIWTDVPTTLDGALVAWVGLGSELGPPALGASAELSVHLVSMLRATVGAGLSWSPPASVGSVSVSMVGVPLRAGLGLRWEATDLEVRASALVTPLFVSGADASGAASRVDVLGGVGLSAAFRLEAPVDLALMAGADLTLDPREYRAHALRARATDRLLVWLGVGVALELIP